MESPKSPKRPQLSSETIILNKTIKIKGKIKAFHDKKQNKGIYD